MRQQQVIGARLLASVAMCSSVSSLRPPRRKLHRRINRAQHPLRHPGCLTASRT